MTQIIQMTEISFPPRIGEEVSSAEVHLKAGSEKARGKTRAQRFASMKMTAANQTDEVDDTDDIGGDQSIVVIDLKKKTILFASDNTVSQSQWQI